jgi:hypothetical protein
MKKKILIGFLAIFLIAQFIQPTKNNGNASGPEDITTALHVPENVMAVLKKSCYDCHSNNTIYPWYDNITPFNWWVADHINEGKDELNFSVFSGYPTKRQKKKLDEIAKTVEKGQMPLKSYLIMHGDAKLTSPEKELLINWARASAKTAIQAPTH